MTTFMRRALIPVVAILIVGGVAAGRISSASSATAPTTYSLTVAGTDAHSLDPHLEPMFVDGGGVEAVDEPSAANLTFEYLEVGLDIPIGAKVTSVEVTYSFCDDPRIPARFTFGSYAPSASTVPLFTLTATHCGKASLTKVGNPVTTIGPWRRYVIDYSPTGVPLYPGDRNEVFYGATIKYTCTSPCVP